MNYPTVNVDIAYIIWLDLILSALIFNILLCYKKAFLDDVFYQKYNTFWVYLATLWYFGGAVYAAAFAISNGGFKLIDIVGFALSALVVLFSIPYLILLLVSLGPAIIQNAYGKLKYRP